MLVPIITDLERTKGSSGASVSLKEGRVEEIPVKVWREQLGMGRRKHRKRD
jgi:hypothetical protein